ncbi:MAG: AraC family transcriptional regulator [Verrucomicrobiota bacterium]
MHPNLQLSPYPSDKVIGTALEFVEGITHEQKCYGTFEEDMPDPSFRFRVALVQHDGDFKMHSHEYSELVIVLGGRATHATEVEEYELETGDVFVIGSGRRHGFLGAQGLKLCNLMFDPAQFLKGRKPLEEMMGYHALFDLQPRDVSQGRFRERLHLSMDDLSYARNIVSNLKLEYSGGEAGRELMIRSSFDLLVTFLCRVYGRKKADTVTPLTAMAKVVSYIRNHYRDPIRIEDLARVAHLSVSQLQRRFRKAYDTSPVQYINNLRLHEACELLKTSDYSVTHIAHDCGFGSSSFFSTQFRQSLGESPSAYRMRSKTKV